MKRKLITLLLSLMCLAAMTCTAFAEEITVPLDVTGLESAHDYTNNASQTWEITYPGAESITMTFDSRTAFENNYDFLYIQSADKSFSQKYTGTALAGQPITVNDDSLTLKLTSDSSQVKWGFKVTEAFATIIYDSIITVDELEHGSVSTSQDYARFGDVVTVAATPDLGYALVGIYVDGEEIDGSFEVTKAEHIVTAEFESQFLGKEVVDGGSCGSDLNWIYFDDGTLYITGTGAMYNYSSSNTNSTAPWYWKYSDQITSVEIDDTVSSIGSYAFLGCSALTEITIPDSVTSIGSSSFSGCSSLEEITLPFVGGSVKSSSSTYQYPLGYIFGTASYTGGVATTQSYYGSRTSSTTSVTYYIPASLRTVMVAGGNILYGAFYNCSMLTEVDLPDDATIIQSRAFNACTALERVVLPDDLESVYNYAFNGCTALEDVFCAQAKGDVTISSYNAGLNNGGTYWHEVSAELTDIVDVTAETCEGGSITLPSTIAAKGEIIAVDVEPEAGYRFAELTIDHGTADGLEVTVASTGHFTEVSIGAVFELANADKTIVTGGTCGSGLTWTIYDDGTLYITGTGAMTSYSEYSRPPWYNFTALVTELILDPGMTTIGSYAFANFDALTEITIPDSVTNIGTYAFYDCDGLTAFGIPDNVTAIGNDSFRNCDSLTAVTIGDSVETVGWNSFEDCAALETVIFGESVTAVHNSAFRDCTALTSVILPESVTTIQNYAFQNCTALESVSLPAGLTSIGENVFAGCPLLTSAGPADSVAAIRFGWADAIPAYAFHNCACLETVELPETVASIGTYAFYGCAALETAELPDAVTEIGDRAFYGCAALSGVTLPTGLTALGSYAFCNCVALVSVEIPEGITDLSIGVFSGCSALETVVLPDTMTAIGSNAFDSCSALEEIDLPEGLETIGEYAFESCDALTFVTIPEGVTTVGRYAFAYCDTLSRVSVPASVTTLDGFVFYGCPKLTSAGPVGGNYSICYGWTDAIPAYAFHCCSAMKTVTIPKSIASIGNYAFYSCNALETVYYAAADIYWQTITIGNNNTPLTNARRVCVSGVEDVLTISVLPAENGSFTLSTTACVAGDRVTVYPVPDPGYLLAAVYVDGEAIEGTSFVVSGNHTVSVEFTFYEEAVANGTCGADLDWCLYENGELRIFGTGAMADYSDGSAPWYQYRKSITTVTVDEGVTSIGNHAFYYCAALTEIAIPEGVTSIGSSAFDGCTSLTEIDLPDSVASIGNYAFYNCTSLEKIVIPEGVPSIKSYTFRNCSSLLNVVIPGSVTSISSYAFYSCTALDAVFYIGTEDGWNSITIDGGNTDLTGARRYYITSPEEVLRITVTGTANGAVTVDRQACVAGETVTVQAIPDPGYKLTAITVDGAPIEGITFTASGDHTVSAAFAFYKEPVASGECGDSARWALYVDGELHISGTGAMTDYRSYSSVPWYAHRSTITGLTIDKGIATIGEGAFYDCDALTAVEIPDSVQTIGAEAFWSCSALTSVEIGDSVITIGEYAFRDCDALTTVEIPDSVITIGRGAFNDCDALTSVESGDSVTAIGEGAFESCSALTSVEIPNSVTTIGEGAFRNCSALTSVEIPDSVTTIGNRAFAYCSALTTVEIPDSVQTIGAEAFFACYALTSVEIPDSVTTIGTYAFYNCGALAEVTIGSGVTAIGTEAFGWDNVWGTNAPDYSSVTFRGNAPTEFGSNVFKTSAVSFVIYYLPGTTGWTSPTWNGYHTACIDLTPGEYSALDGSLRNSQGILFTLNEDALTAVVGDNSTAMNNAGYFGNSNGRAVIPAVVTYGGKTYRVIGIGQYAFAGNENLKTLELGANVTSVDSTAFAGCDNLTAFSVAEGSTHYSAADGILYDAVGYYLYCWPAGKTGETYAVPETVQTIGQYAFFGSDLTEISVPDSVQTIGAGAFADCGKLEKITLPFIGASRNTENPFYYVFNVQVGNKHYFMPESLKTVVITGGKLSNSCFYNCEYLESITLPAQDTVIPDYCFQGCAALKELLFTDTLAASQDLPEGHVILPERITAIGYEAFRNCRALTFVDLPESLREIEGYAFYNCTGLQRVEIPAGVENIGYRAFDLCTSVMEFVVAAGNEAYCSDQWGVLYTRDQIRLVTYPAARKWPYYNVSDRTTRVDSYAFNTCANLVNLYIPNTVTRMEGGCIVNCPGMTVCAYTGSAAYTYAGEQSLNAWPMDNYTLQGIEIYALPEQVVAKMGEEDFSGLYMAVNYGGRQLQLDEYTVTYDEDRSGIQTVTVTFGGYTASFEILLYNGKTECLVDFGALTLEEGTVGYMAVYDADGKMLAVEEARIFDGRVLMVAPRSAAADSARLFLLDTLVLVPVSAPVRPVQTL